MPYLNWRGQVMPETAAEQARIAGTSAGNETMYAPAGNSSVSGEGGGDVLVGSSGDNRHWITDRNDKVIEQPGGGIDTTIGWTAIKLAANVENLIVHGDRNYAAGNDLPNLIQVDGRQWVYGAGGDDVLVGGFNPVTFVVRAGEGNDVIYGWNSGSQLQLWNYGLGSAAQIKQAMVQQGSDVVLKFANGESLTFRDTTLASFHDKQFLLPLDRSKLGALTFSDEFNSLQLYDFSTQTGLWRTNFGNNLKDIWAYSLPSNGEQQVYVDSAFQGTAEGSLDFNPFSVSNGVLTIKAEHISADKQAYTYGRDYASGMINTLGSFEQKYGYFEINAQLPTAKGAWSAFWMFPTPFISGIEADILESLGLTPNVDYRRAYGSDINAYDDAYKVDPTGFHKYGMLWTPTTVTFYYDDVAVLSTPTPANWTVPMGLIVNFAVGGWGGVADPAQFPAEMKVDYVRVYGLADNSQVVERTDFQAPVGTLRVAGSAAGQANTPVAFSDGQPVTSAKILVSASKPAGLGAEKTFVVWEQGGAVYGSVWNGSSYGQAVVLGAGSVSQYSGAGTWLTTGKVVVGYLAPDGGGKAAWALVFDPARNTFVRQELGAATGDLRFVATQSGGFGVSWDAPDGSTMGRAYDEYAYGGDIPGWYGPARVLAGDLSGVTAGGQLIAGGQLYNILGASVTPGGGGGGGSSAGDDYLTGQRLFGGEGADTLNGTPGQDYLRGENGADVMYGGDAFDDMHGGWGEDRLYGGNDGDWVVGGQGNDMLYGEEGHDVVLGNLGNDTVDGAAGNDWVRGGQGNDSISAGWGDDYIAGDRGDDTISGGGGADIFHIFGEAGLDRVLDFSRADGDRVNVLSGYSYTLAQEGADTVITLSGGARMVLVGVQLATLDPGWIYVS